MADAQPSKTRLHEAKERMYRTHILDVAEEVFAASGFEGARVKQVASGAGISLSTLYGHFANKTALYRGVHARRLDDLMGRLKGSGDDQAEPLDRLLGAIEIYIAFHMEHPTYLRMHLREGNAWSDAEGLRSPEQLDTWRAGLKRMAAAFEAGMKAGVFVAEDPMLAARTTNALHQVALSHWVQAGLSEAPEHLLGRLHGQFIRTFCTPESVVELLAARGLKTR